MIVWKQRSPSAITAAMVGPQIGLVVGTVAIANHLIEAFVPTRPFVLIISPVLLTLALLGAAGAAPWERTGSLLLAVISGVYCARPFRIPTAARSSSALLKSKRELTRLESLIFIRDLLVYIKSAPAP